MEKLQIIYLPVDALTPYDKNARKHKEADIKVIKASIEKFGFDDPIGIWGDKNIIVEGHGRLLAAKELNYKEVPCVRLDHLSDEDRKAYALTHNRSAELSAWDMENLDAELKALQEEFDLISLGFEDFLNTDEPAITDDNFDEDLFIPEEPVSQPGDIFLLGDHRVICADSRNKDFIDLLIGDNVVDFVLTDPPYNVNYEGKTADHMKLNNDNMSDEDFEDFLYKSFANMADHAKEGANFFVFHSDSRETAFRTALEKVGIRWHQTWIWKKNSIVLGHGWAHYQHEPIWVGWKEGAAHYDTGDRSLSTILEYDRPTKSLEHPTMKPLDLLGYLIQQGSKKGDICLDLFGGSGSTLVACDEAGRICFSCDNDPKYVDVIVKRYLRHKGSAENCYLIRNGEKLDLPLEYKSVI